MIHKEDNWKSHDGLNLFAQSWSPDDEIKKTVIIIHGIGEHSTRYDHWAERFVRNSYAVLTMDQRGCGKSEGKKGHIPNYESILKDTDLLVSKSKELFPNKPVVIYGHSMGGNIILNYCLRREEKPFAAIVSAPWIRLAMTPPKLLLFVGNTMKNILPGFTQRSKIPLSYISRDQQEVEKYKNDPLIHDKVSVMTGMSFLEAGEWSLENAEKYDTPLLLMHGSGDQITSHKATESFYKKAHDVASIKIWEGCYHELHHEFEREQVFQHVIDWLNKLK